MLIKTFTFLLCFLLLTQINAKRRKGELKITPDAEEWNGKWFPFDPKTPPELHKEKPPNDVESLNDVKETEDWNLKWFPFDPKKTPTTSKLKSPNEIEGLDNFKGTEKWQQKWFPFKPSNTSFEKTKEFCDDGQNSIEVDFNPNDKRHSFNYRCLYTNRTLFEPNMQLEALLEAQFIPPAFVPPVKCLNETISYEFPLNTFGAFRPTPPQYGTYVYLPEQRWLHSIAKGAVVMLYHPCANLLQVKILQDILRCCLYRHIITPSQELTPERPLALLAWGKLLQMSVVDEKLAVDFIKTNAKHGPMPIETSLGTKGTYAAGLVAEAKLITDIEDTEICGYKEM